MKYSEVLSLALLIYQIDFMLKIVQINLSEAKATPTLVFLYSLFLYKQGRTPKNWEGEKKEKVTN